MKGWMRVLAISLLMTSLVPVGIQSGNWSGNHVSKQPVMKPAYTLHDPIIIASDADFTAQALVESWPGNGTEIEPYVIEDYLINTEDMAIRITDTTVYFEIRYCFIACTNSSYDWIGYRDRSCILLDNVTNALIHSANITSFRYGIQMINVIDCEIRNCTVNIEMSAINVHCIDIRVADSCTVLNNTFIGAHSIDRGLFLEYVYNLNITLNKFTGSGIGMWGREMSSSSISDNEFYDNLNDAIYCDTTSDLNVTNNFVDGQGHGFSFGHSENLTLLDNTFTKSGIRIVGSELRHWNTHTIQGNYIDGRPILYLNGQFGLFVDLSPYSAIIMADCVNCTVYGGQFNGTTGGILAGFCHDCAIVGNDGSDLYGFFITLSDSTECNIIDNNATDIRLGAISVSVSDQCIIADNRVEWCQWPGVALGRSVGCLVKTNRLIGNQNGVFLDDSNNSRIEQNYIDSCAYGIMMMDSKDTLIDGNNIFSGYDGIRIAGSNFTSVIGNWIYENEEHGIFMESTSFNSTVVNNRLWDNLVVNAIDNGEGNQWDDGVSMGNGWGDYSGSGDYDISGSANSTDHYPFMYAAPTTTLATTTTTPLGTTPTSTSPTPTTSITTSTTTRVPPPIDLDEMIRLLGIIITVGCIGIIVLFSIMIARSRRKR